MNHIEALEAANQVYRTADNLTTARPKNTPAYIASQYAEIKLYAFKLTEYLADQIAQIRRNDATPLPKHTYRVTTIEYENDEKKLVTEVQAYSPSHAFVQHLDRTMLPHWVDTCENQDDVWGCYDCTIMRVYDINVYYTKEDLKIDLNPDDDDCNGHVIERKEPPIVVYQDGREFYDDSTGCVIFTSSFLVPDFYTDAARNAREEFMVWAKRNNVNVKWKE